MQRDLRRTIEADAAAVLKLDNRARELGGTDPNVAPNIDVVDGRPPADGRAAVEQHVALHPGEAGDANILAGSNARERKNNDDAEKPWARNHSGPRPSL